MHIGAADRLSGESTTPTLAAPRRIVVDGQAVESYGVS